MLQEETQPILNKKLNKKSKLRRNSQLAPIHEKYNAFNTQRMFWQDRVAKQNDTEIRKIEGKKTRFKTIFKNELSPKIKEDPHYNSMIRQKIEQYGSFKMRDVDFDMMETNEKQSISNLYST